MDEKQRIGNVVAEVNPPPKKVYVLMPYGGDETDKRRLAILEFLSLKYMINLINEDLRKEANSLQYDVNVCETFIDGIAANALQKISDADVIIAMLQDRNINVIYEVAFRHLLRDQMIIMVKGNANEQVPVYLRDKAHLLSPFPQKVMESIEFFGKSTLKKYQNVSFQDSHPPEDLQEEVSTHSNAEITTLKQALEEIRQKGPSPSSFISNQQTKQETTSSSEPLRLSNWAAYLHYPISIVKFSWNKMSHLKAGRYEPTDLDAEQPPIIFDGNTEFRMLYGLEKETEPDLSKLNIDASQLIEKLHSIVDPQDLEDFTNDQIRLQPELIFVNAPTGNAKVPIKLKKHRFFQDKWFLPCLIGKQVIGKLSGPHETYLMIVYIEIDYQKKLSKPTLDNESISGVFRIR
jgi:hypothetical protein